MAAPGSFGTITLKIVEGVAEIRLNRPQVLNAIDSAMLTELGAALDIAEADESVSAIVVAGEGRAFSAGFDLKESAARGETSARQWREILEADFDLIMRFWDCPKPTIAAVHGHCVGGGFEIAMACDMTLAAEDAVMGEPEVRFGSGIVALILPWITGPKQAKEILLAGRDRITAARALEMGLVNRVVAPGELMAAAYDMAQDIRAGARDSVRLTKLAINRSYELMGMRAALRQALELDIFIEASGGPERAEFNRIRRESGLKAAIAWREGRRGGSA
ncbi:enoyl-CoA hydratase/isomerase family protein [Limibaculum sp. FT325]|uniref:enoyl-CoA hydratase/isomerase family protein n=1 Tax=Thermohalobaculum sediminis TaxID=2939436 RepID=UPI0020C00B0A|nr:enoyl-CoA hydratase/isomerase family protein [Limibaculum sediminis]MCL5776143.1 enoyl-CoA hydratase/isomerase family protein [Limibaculum sediminis]